ncbi:MAG: M1 family aminopeptidase [Thaumarchaeota archaeon]|nr:M1 family aminopeptidase [Nitrososphaerota archaeon]
MRAEAYRSFHIPESSVHYPPSKEFHTEHARIELSLDFERKRVWGSCSLTVTPLKAGMKRLGFDACGLEISEVTLDGTKCDFEYDLQKLFVASAEPLSGSHVVKVSYSTTPVEGIYFIQPDAEHPEKEVQAWTHNEAEFARYWYPCYDHPNDKFTSEILLTVPKEFRVISNGSLVDRKEDGDLATFHWKEDLTHSSYLTSFVVGKFALTEEESDGVKLNYNYPKSKEADVLRYFGETPRMIQVFNELTGVKYPYSKYDQTTVEDFIFGGMENFNATTFAMGYYPDAGSEEDFQTYYSRPNTNAVNLVAHELAHQWFGDLVTCVDWSHGWLNEGFATYMQVLYIEKTRGADSLRWDMEVKAEEYFEEDATEYRRPIVDREYVYPDDLFDLAMYEKGAWMLHELRYLMGEKPFFDGVSVYLRSNSFGVVDTHDFRKAMEKASGYSLEEFFEQAFFRAGFPEFLVAYSWDEDGKLATLSVNQTQKLEQFTPVFKLPCDFVFYAGGRRVRRRVQLDSAQQSFSFGLDSKPTIVEFDPRHWLLKKVRFDKGAELLINQLEGSEDASSRADAAKGLGEAKASIAVGPLRSAAMKDHFWHVNASALKALGEIGTKESLEALLQVGTPKNRRTRRALAEALGNYKDERARSALTKLLESDESPYVRCQAALALGESWPEGAFPLLLKSMEVHSPNETLAEACLDAMGKLKDQSVIDVIRDNLGYGRPTRVRIGALKAIQGRGHVLGAELPVLREMLQKDKEFRVRYHLVSKLIPSLGDKRFLEALKEAATHDRDPRVKRKALEVYRELSSASEASGALSKLREEVEVLKEQNRQLLLGAGASAQA